MARNAEVILRTPNKKHNEKYYLSIKGSAMVDYYPQHQVEVVLKIDDKIIAKKLIEKNGNYTIDCIVANELPKLLKLSIVLNRSFIPSQTSNSGDNRELGLAVSSIELL